MKKEFVDYNTVRNNALKLAGQIYSDGFIPDVIYVSLRGGAYIGNVISEFYKAIKSPGRPVFYAAVVARSYEDINTRVKVHVDGWTYSPEYLRQGDKILLVDDIFDSGHTINYLVEILLEKGIPRKDIKVVVRDYKVREYQKQQLPVQPDYYTNKYVLKSANDDFWIHYLSHELIGLTDDEKEKHYFSEDKDLKKPFKFFNN